MGKLYMFILVLELSISLFAQNPYPPSNFNALKGNGFIRMSWINPPSNTYTGIEIYQNGVLYTTISSTDQTTIDLPVTRHIRYPYYLKAIYDDGYTIYRSVSTPIIYSFAYRKFYVSNGGNGNGSSASSPKAISTFQSSGSGDGWSTHNLGGSIGTGFFKGDTVVVVGTCSTNVNTFAIIALSDNDGNETNEPMFPASVTNYSNQQDRLVFLSVHLDYESPNYAQSIIAPGGANSTLHGFQTDGADYIEINGFHFDGVGKGDGINSSSAKWCINASRSSNSVIKNNYFDFTSGRGCILMQSGTESSNLLNNTIEFNTVVQACTSGVWGLYYRNGLPEGNNGDFIQIGGPDQSTLATIDDIHIRYNDITLQATSDFGSPGEYDDDIPQQILCKDMLYQMKQPLIFTIIILSISVPEMIMVHKGFI
ncbi:MAG: hypothetical protein ACM3O3_08545 [Syntrophothermus sp.]